MPEPSFPSSLTRHGGRLDDAATRFPDVPTPWLDLSTGINPRAFPVAAATIANQHVLPSVLALARLEQAAARAFGLRHGATVALPGSEIGLRLLAALGLPTPIAIVRPGYRTPAEVFPDAVRLTEPDQWSGRGTLLMANPNNPDGRLAPPERLLALVRGANDRGAWLVVDEAFADAVPGSSVLPLLEASDRVLVLRSFGKFFGLAGVRLGFACGHPAMVGRQRQWLGDWPVSASAIALGTAAYADADWADATRAALTATAARLDALLASQGLDPTGACPLFRLVATPEAPMLFERLGHAGILIRAFDDAPTWLRFGLPADDAAFDRLDRALRG